MTFDERRKQLLEAKEARERKEREKEREKEPIRKEQVWMLGAMVWMLGVCARVWLPNGHASPPFGMNK
eukprot:278180-Pyramimonas_sp.AAC.2